MKSLITGALALALLASAAPAALAQDRPDRQNDDGSRSQGGGRGQDHQAPQHQAPPQPAAQPAPHPAAAPPAPGAQPQGQPQGQPGPRGYYRSDGQGGYRGQANGQAGGQGQAAPNPGQPPARSPGQYPRQPQYQQGQPQGQPQGQGRDNRNDGRNDGRYGGQHDAGRPSAGPPPPGMRDDRQDNRYRQDDGRRNDDGRRYDNRGSGDGRAYNGGRPGQDWQRDRPRYDRHDYPFRFDNHQRYRGFAYYPPRGFYIRHWGFGDIVPRSWWGQDYRLNDWWAYGLPIPPLGYEWVRVGDDALLIDIYSGRVVQVAYDIFY